MLLPSGDNFPQLIQKRRSQLGFVTYLLNYPRTTSMIRVVVRSVAWTWDHNHHDQVIIRLYKCTGVNTVVKQIIFEECIKIVEVESCMYYEINVIFIKYKCLENTAWNAYSLPLEL